MPAPHARWQRQSGSQPDDRSRPVPSATAAVREPRRQLQRLAKSIGTATPTIAIAGNVSRKNATAGRWKIKGSRMAISMASIESIFLRHWHLRGHKPECDAGKRGDTVYQVRADNGAKIEVTGTAGPDFLKTPGLVVKFQAPSISMVRRRTKPSGNPSHRWKLSRRILGN